MLQIVSKYNNLAYMEYRKLGKSGLKVSVLSFGSWLTFGTELNIQTAGECMRLAFSKGVNFFDNAESYGGGASEMIMGENLKEYRRSDLVISTKLFWGGEGPNDLGLSRKHIIEGANNSLSRLRLDYVDLLFCHRPDPNTPIEETVLAMDLLIRSGKALYWGTSEWTNEQITKACEVAKELNAPLPSCEQPEFNLLRRNRVEKELMPTITEYGIGLTIWGPLASGILTGKYNHGVPKDSRFARHPAFQRKVNDELRVKLDVLKGIAEKLDMTMASLALCFCLKNPNVSTVILGASNTNQLEENLNCLRHQHKLTDEVAMAIDDVFSGSE